MKESSSLRWIQRVVTTILNELVNDENYDITVVMPFKMSGEKLFKIDERIKLKNQEELSVNREHKPVRYIFALNKRIGFLDNGISLPFVLNNRIAPQEKENYIKYFNKEKFDVVIGAGIEYSLLLGEIKKDIPAKTIGWQHSTYGSYFEKRGATGYGLMKYVKKCYSALDGIWVLTNSDKTEFDNNLGIESKVLYNPLPKNDSVSTTYEEGYVLFAGRLEREHKGLDYLIDVIKKISEEVPELRVTIIGDGPSHNWLNAEIEKAGLGEKVNLLGTTDNVYQFYERASVMVQTSRWEGFGMTILEAMSCGMQEKQSITVRCMDIEDLEKQAEAIRVEQIKLYESYADGVLRRDAYIEKKKILSEKLAALQDSIQTEKEEQECADELDEEIRALTKQASEKTYIGGLTKECVDAFVSMVYLYDDQTMKIEFNCEDVIRRALEKYGA